MIEIREMSFVDAWAEIEHLFKAQFEETEDSDKYEFNVNIEVFQSMDDIGCLQIFVAFRDEVPVGYYTISMQNHPHKDAVTAREEAIYVVPEERGNGLCTQMYKQVEDFLQDQGVEIFYMTIKAGQTDALVDKLGFEVEETVYKKYL